MNSELYLQVTKDNVLNAPEDAKYMCIENGKYYRYTFGEVYVYTDDEWVLYEGEPIGMTRSIMDMEYAVGMHHTYTEDVLNCIQTHDGITADDITLKLEGKLHTVCKQIVELLDAGRVTHNDEIPVKYFK